MKGQTLVFEQVLLFTMGIAIFIASFAIFAMYQNQYLEVTVNDQLTAVKEYVMLYIANLAKMGEFNSSLTIGIPRTISDNYYRIKISNGGINVSTHGGAFSHSGFGTLNRTFEFEGEVISSVEQIVIYKIGNKILLR